MRAPCQALVLEDDPAELDLAAEMMREVFLEPIPAVSPDQALNKLNYYQPVLAVLDLDMSKAPRSTASVDDVLARLYDDFGGCFVLIYSVRADEILERKRIELIHPLAMFVAKQDGREALLDRIRRLMGIRYGDLVVKQGLTFHEPSGESFPHSVGVSLMLGAALGQEVVLEDTEAKAARRMRAWLERVGSRVSIVDHGRRCYALHYAEVPA